MHIFGVRAIHAEKLLEISTLKEYLARARFYAESVEAIKAFETGDYKSYSALTPGGLKTWSPHYFGASIEFLAECFLEMYGSHFNVYDIKSVDDFESDESDTGVDHYAKTISPKLLKSKNALVTRKALEGSPVYIQTKATANKNKMFKTNDGSRLPNFFMNAQSKAIADGVAYQARYILFTTGKGIHYVLDDNSGNKCEVINYNMITKRIDGNETFFNYMREKCNVKQVHVNTLDVEAMCNNEEFKQLDV